MRCYDAGRFRRDCGPVSGAILVWVTVKPCGLAMVVSSGSGTAIVLASSCICCGQSSDAPWLRTKKGMAGEHSAQGKKFNATDASSAAFGGAYLGTPASVAGARLLLSKHAPTD